MAWVPYDSYLKSMCAGSFVDWDDNSTTTIKIAIVTNSYSPNRATHDFFDDVSSYQVSGTNYTADGNAISARTVTVASNVVTVDGNDPATWSQSASGFSNGRYLILYKDTGTASTSQLIAYHQATSDFGNVDGDLTVTLSASGIFTLAAS